MAIVLTQEQKEIIDAICSREENVLVSAVAGASKTFTSLRACKHLVDRVDGVHIMLLTYNSHLKTETRRKVEDLGLATRVRVFSYHSACVFHYDPVNGMTDVGIDDVVRNDTAPLQCDVCFNVLIIDEAQDMTPMYMHFVLKLLRDNQHNDDCTVAIFGDERQCIYEFKDADPRFFRLSPEILASSLPSKSRARWKRLSLSTSFRITRPICKFVNLRMLGGKEVMRATKHGPPVHYVISSNLFVDPFRIVMKELREHGMRPGDIFVLAPSLRSRSTRSPIKRLENMLVNENVPCFVSVNDDMTVEDTSVLRGKVVFSTFHQSKGLERPVVIVIGFDDSFGDLFQQKTTTTTTTTSTTTTTTAAAPPPSSCPNELYVAATRASQKLVLVHSNRRQHLPFLDIDGITSDPDVAVHMPKDNRVFVSATPPPQSTTTSSVSAAAAVSNVAIDIHRACKFKPSAIIIEAARVGAVTCTKRDDDYQHLLSLSTTPAAAAEPKKHRHHRHALTTKVYNESNQCVEYVGDLYKTVLSYVLNRRHRGGGGAGGGGDGGDGDDSILTRSTRERYRKLKSVPLDKLDFADVAFICNVEEALAQGFIHRTAQITKYDWAKGSRFHQLKNVACSLILGDSSTSRIVPGGRTVCVPCGESTRLMTTTPLMNLTTRTTWTLTMSPPSLDAALRVALQAYIISLEHGFNVRACVFCLGDCSVYQVSYDHAKMRDAIQGVLLLKQKKGDHGAIMGISDRGDHQFVRSFMTRSSW